MNSVFFVVQNQEFKRVAWYLIALQKRRFELMPPNFIYCFIYGVCFCAELALWIWSARNNKLRRRFLPKSLLITIIRLKIFMFLRCNNNNFLLINNFWLSDILPAIAEFFKNTVKRNFNIIMLYQIEFWQIWVVTFVCDLICPLCN